MVSIIVPVYNTAELLERSVKSLCVQTCADIEIILIDDGSTDSSGGICDRLALEDDRIKVIHKPNGGLSSARNAGLEIANGDYILFVDSDDFVEVEYVQAMLTEAETKQLDMVLCNYRFVNEAGEPVENRFHSSFASHGIIDGVEALKLFEDKSYYTFFDVVWNKLYRRELFDGIRFPEGISIVEDIAIMPLLYHRVLRLAAIDDILYDYTYRASSLSHTRMSKLKDIQLRGPVLEERLKWYIEWNIKELVLVHIIHMYSAYRAVLKSIDGQDTGENTERIKQTAYDTAKLNKRMKELQKLFRRHLAGGSFRDYQSLKQRLKFLLAAISLKLYDRLAVG